MTDNAESNRLLDEAARVLASQIAQRNDVIRVGVLDIIINDQLWWKFVLAFAKESLVRPYIESLSMDTKRQNHYDEFARKLLLGWRDSLDMLDWVEANCQTAFRFNQTSDGKPMHIDHWASQISSVEVVIVPGSGMELRGDDRLIVRSSLSDDEGHRRAATILTDIYHQAYLGRHGMNTNAIIGPRPGVRFFNPHTQEFEMS